MTDTTTPVERAVEGFVLALARRNASAHTIKAYRTDLAGFAEFVGPEELAALDHALLRAYMAHLYERGLGKTS